MKSLRLLVFTTLVSLSLVVACVTGRSAAGNWESASGFLVVEPSQLVWFDPAYNDLSVAKVVGRGDELVTRHRGRIERIHLVPVGDALNVTVAGKTEVCHRTVRLPPAMSLTPLPLPAPSDLPPATIETIRDEIAKRNAADQQLLKSKAPHEQIQAQEESNDAYLREIAGRYGWLDRARFGGKTAGAAIVMAKHSADTRLLLAAMPVLERDIQSDRGEFAQTFAIAYDQLLLSLGQQQRYGSQGGPESGLHPFLCSVQTPSRLDERRASIGLDPIAIYLKLVSKMLYNNQPVHVPADADLQ